MSNEIPESLRLFLRRNINSVSLLDVLFLLKRGAPQTWSPEELSVEMRTNKSYAASQLAELQALNLIHLDGTKYIYDPSPQDREMIEALESLYNSRRSTVINFIYSQPIDSIRDFADAFKIKKD
ncbi:hypothetical protein AZI86_16030 [Bdellovibrio bacteriovorus]|uniref:HTH marR-type domain-containing protein n=1 Tax=Bdellovibrio bacteriovorus TaxID=959 RepID=A0A150WHV9_BDEBC|nr:hypothetical protein [Bdellovibrio bacteriovorus]KYG63210.1 hypothetical protein AZI86_16030 [Bdellovibrio bacteriovorus]